MVGVEQLVLAASVRQYLGVADADNADAGWALFSHGNSSCRMRSVVNIVSKE
jgi:hypothetical protein